MSGDLRKALILAAIRLLLNMPWVLAGATAFYGNKRASRRTIIASLCAIALFILASNVFLRGFMVGEHYYLLDQIATVLTYVIIMFFFALCYRLHAAALIYVFCLLHAVSTLVNQLSYMIANIISPVGTPIAILQYAPYSILMVGMTLLCAPFLYRFCRNALNEAFETLEAKSIWQLCIVPMIFFVIFQFALPIMMQFNGACAVFFLLILLFAAAILTYVVNLQAAMGGANTMRLRAETEETKKLLTMQERGYAQLLGSIEQAQAARHDLRFHLSVVSEFAQKGDTEALSEYLKSYTKRLDTKELKYCDNAAVDALVRHFMLQAEAQGISCDCMIALPAKTGVADTDLCVVLGNLLENALHSLEKQGGDSFLRLRCAEQGRRILITADNSLPQDFSGFQKGIGLQSVCAVATRYGGDTKLEAIDGMFKASVILHLP